MDNTSSSLSPQSQFPTQPQATKISLVPLLLTGLVCATVFGVTGFYIGRQTVSSQQAAVAEETTKLSEPNTEALKAKPDAVIEDTKPGWEVYSNSNAGLTFQHPSKIQASMAGVYGTHSFKTDLVGSFADETTIMMDTDAPFDGFSIYEVTSEKVDSDRFSELVANELNAIKNANMGDPDAVLTSKKIGQHTFSIIMMYAKPARYFVASPTTGRMVTFSVNHKNYEFISEFEEMLSTFKFID